MSSPSPFAASYRLRTSLRPGDVEAIVRFHRSSYERDHGFDPTFAAHVEGPLRAFAAAPTSRECVWIAERGEALQGCVAIVEAARAAAHEASGNGAESLPVAANAAQLRWFLVAPEARGAGLGRRLLREAIEFSRAAGYADVILWTVDVLVAAAHLYRSADFVKVESRPAQLWGVDLAEEKYSLRLK